MPNNDLQKYAITDTAIAAMRDEFMPLVIRDVSDADGFKAVHSARMVVKNHRVSVEKVRKELKADALEYGRKVDAEAKRITAMLEPIESHLSAQEDAHEKEKWDIANAARLKAEAEVKAKEEAEAARIKAEQEAEQAKIKAVQDAENARLKAEADRLAEQQRILNEDRQKIEEEKKRLADIEATRQRAIEIEQAKIKAVHDAKRETEERMAREAKAAQEKAEAEEAARQRAEALRPDREKLLSVVAAVVAIDIPEVSPLGEDSAKQIKMVLRDACGKIHSIINNIRL